MVTAVTGLITGINRQPTLIGQPSMRPGIVGSMSLKITYKYTCDYAGCGNTKEFTDIYSADYALDELEKSGWTIARVEEFCPEH
jgi:hypothetical protein